MPGRTCPCAYGSGAARNRRRSPAQSDSEVLTEIEEQPVQSDEEGQEAEGGEAGEQQDAEEDQPSWKWATSAQRASRQDGRPLAKLPPPEKVAASLH